MHLQCSGQKVLGQRMHLQGRGWGRERRIFQERGLKSEVYLLERLNSFDSNTCVLFYSVVDGLGTRGSNRPTHPFS